MAAAGKGHRADQTRVVAYLRVSTSGQEREGLGLPGQRAEIERYCRERGWEIVGIYEDVISGAAADEDRLALLRPGFKRLIEEANGERGIKYVVVHESSRLARGDLARVLVQRDLKRAGLDVRSVTEPRYSIRSLEPSDEFFKAIMDAASVYERKVISARMRRGRLIKAERGGYSGGQAPYGYDSMRGSKALTINDAEARVVRQIFTLKRRGLTPHAIAQYLNKASIPTRRGRLWSNVVVDQILERRKFYQGKEATYAGVKAKGMQAPIL